MKFVVGRVTDYSSQHSEQMEVATLEDLLEWVSSLDDPVIIFQPEDDEEWHLEIYDDYRE